MLRVYDTLTRCKQEISPRTPGEVAIYVCGPTVYDVPHMGHARSALVFDVLRRYLAWSGLRVVHVSNVTDIDDKIITRAREEGGSEPEVAARYEAVYRDQMDRLGVLRPHEVPHATAYIDSMLQLVGRLVDAGAAYAVDEGAGASVYFSVSAYPGYGELSHRRVTDLLEGAGARVDVDERKRSPIDFALWKAAKQGEPAWPSPWGKGRPGWHIECSAMSVGLLGPSFDIHGGGDDLVFPHHENERAQSEAAGDAFARCWMHHGMVLVGGEKMSKSLGNFTTLADALDTFDSRALRLLVLQTHYRSPMEMGLAHLRDAEVTLSRLDALTRRMDAAGIDRTPAGAERCDPGVLEAFRAAMDDDCNTPSALAVVFEAVRAANQALDAGDASRAGVLAGTVVELAAALGLEVGVMSGARAGDLDDAAVLALVEARDAARRARDFAEADRIRAELAQRAVVLEDTPSGTVWHR